MVRQKIDKYVSESLTKTQQEAKDLEEFELISKIQEIDPVLWNFVFLTTATDTEQKAALTDFCWSVHVLSTGYTDPTISTSRLFHKLFICLVIKCLKKQLAHSKWTGKPVGNLDQLIKLPTALSSADGMPEKALKGKYPNDFLVNRPLAFANDVAVILEGMFMLNTSPLGCHRSFRDYNQFLYERWISTNHQTYGAVEVHVVFDHPQRHGVSPKDVERQRRDQNHVPTPATEISTMDETSALPTN
jgi:hypothetical protein